MKSGPNVFKEFIDESTLVLNTIRLKANNLEDPQVLNQVFRDTHSLKGSAKLLDLNFIASISHKIEDILAGVQKNSDPSRIPISEIEDLIVDLFHEFKNLSKMIDRLKVFSTLDLVVKPPEWKGQLGEFLKSLPDMVETIASDLKKNVKLEIENSIENMGIFSKLKNPIIHLIRNSIDHGIEDPFERLTKSKPASGKITLRFTDIDNRYYIEVEDDGHGIDFDKIKEIALKKNLIKDLNKELSRADLIRFIFTPNFSSKTEVSELSGRGYGLDIVKEAAELLKGKISVKTKKDCGTNFIISVPHD